MTILAKHFLSWEISSAPQAVSVHLFNTDLKLLLTPLSRNMAESTNCTELLKQIKAKKFAAAPLYQQNKMTKDTKP